jgi:hypothetical protein
MKFLESRKEALPRFAKQIVPAGKVLDAFCYVSRQKARV